MAHNRTIHDVVFIERRVEIPEACPKCGAVFHDGEEKPLREWDLHDVQHVTSFESPAEDADLDYSHDEDDGDLFYPMAYYCQCGHALAEGACGTVSRMSPITPETLHAVWAESQGED